MKISSLGVLLLFTACASAPGGKDPDAGIEALIAQGRALGYRKYGIRVHSPVVAPLLKPSYAREDREAIRRALGASLDFSLDGRGLARAADRVDADENDPTHYDAVWVRDSLWIYLALKAEPADAEKAKKLLLTIADYFASADQIARFDAVIDNPLILNTPEGAMKAVHIRFDRKSPTFADVTENGRSQTWNHKQNDALGLFLDLFCRAVLAGGIAPGDLTPARVKMIERFPAYFAAIHFEAFPDAGTWEEIERVNTSSIGLVVSGLERLALARKSFPDVKFSQLNALIAKGYRTIFKQLAAGGESPSYPEEDPHFRKSDAALLNLIYPAELSRLHAADYAGIVRAVTKLAGDVGVKRYLGDSYQSGNFWFQSGTTEDTSSEGSFAERGAKFIPGSEAQWFFDSWFSVALTRLAKRYPKNPNYAVESVRYLNRALAQVTGGTREAPVLGADGKPVPPLALPESYNTIVDRKSGARAYAPSPITPLNWAKATLRLALSQK